MRLLIPFILLLLVPVATAHPWDDAAPDNVTFSLVTADPGRNQAAAWFGHTGILVESENETRYYAYRLHIADTPTRAIKTTFTDVAFSLYGQTWQSKLDEYQEQERSVRVAEIDLSPDEKARLIAGLASELARQDDPYVYRIIADNCSTRIRDLLDATLDEGLPPAMALGTGFSVRDMGPQYIEHDVLQANLLYLFLGPGNDRELTGYAATFMPLELESWLTDYGIIGAPETALEFSTPAFGPGHYRIVATAASFGLLMALPIAGLGVLHRRGDPDAGRMLGKVLAGLGILLALPVMVMALTWTNVLALHFHDNLNAFLFSPLLLAWIPVGVQLARGKSSAWRTANILARIQLAFAGIALLLHLAGAQGMDNTLAAMIPFHLAAWAAFSFRAVPAGSEPHHRANDALAPRAE